MMRTAYLDCFSGISGDMLLGALLDAGLEPGPLRGILDKLPVSGYRLDISHTALSSIRATRVSIETVETQQYRHLPDIAALLGAADLEPAIHARSVAVFSALAAAEAKVHGCTIDEVHFHEVGAMDAIIDIVGVVAGLNLLGIDRVHCSPLPMPTGWIKCEHGDLPLPAPAVCELLKGVPVFGDNIDQELVTPTGAALLKVLATGFGPMPPMQLAATGYGAGSSTRSDGRPNLLRLLIGEELQVDEAQLVEVIETSLDDWSPETWPHVAARLQQGGALDLLLIPVHMKKGRPGFLLRVICDPAAAEDIKQIILTETSAIGLRFHREERRTLPRQEVTVTTRWGVARAKRIETPDGALITPEYEDCRLLATAAGIPIRRVYDEVSRLAGDSVES